MNVPCGARVFDWPALMRVGLRELGLPPEVFWRLGPAELLLMLGDAGPEPLGRDAFAALLKQYPDGTDSNPRETDDGRV